MVLSRFALSLLVSFLATTSAWAIINGYRPDPRKVPVADRLVVVILPGSKCTGTLLTDRVVLTAAHCDNANYPLKDGFAPHSAQWLAYLKGTSFVRRGSQPGVKAIDGIVLKRYWGKGGTEQAGDGKMLGDIMLLLLEQPMALSSEARVSLLANAIEDFPALLALGYGVSEVQDGRLKAVGLRQQVSIGDGVRGSELDTFDIVSPKGGALCQGDSGGPVFQLAANGAWELTGVYSSLEYKVFARDRFTGGPADGSVEQCQRAKWFTLTSVRAHESWIMNGIKVLYRRNNLPAAEAVVR